MKNRLLFLTTLLMLLISESYSQKINNWDMTQNDKKVARKFTNNFFLSGGITPLLSYYRFKANDVQHKYFDVFNIEVGLRYNVFNYRDFLSVSVVTYPNFGLNTDSYISGILFSVPIGVDFNMYNNSTYNNINKVGFSVGAGRAFNFGIDSFSEQTTYIRGVVRYNKYARKFSKKHKESSKLINGYFGFQYGFNSAFELDSGTKIKDYSNFKILIGRTFGL